MLFIQDLNVQSDSIRAKLFKFLTHASDEGMSSKLLLDFHSSLDNDASNLKTLT